MKMVVYIWRYTQTRQLIMIPKPKFFERIVPIGQSEDDYFDEIIARQAHFLRDAIDQVSFLRKL